MTSVTGGPAHDDVSRCRDEELPELGDFLARMLGRSSYVVDPARTAWLFTRNPHAGVPGAGPWVCRRDGAIVGTVADAAFELHVDGRPRLAAWAIDAVVDPKWRGTHAAAAMWKARRHLPVVRASLGLSEAGYAWAVRCGWRAMGTVSGYVHVLNARRFSPGRRAGHPLVGAARPLVALGVGVGRRRARAHGGGVTATTIDEFDERSEVLWREVAPSYRVIGARDAVSLHWRFDEGPDRGDYVRSYLSHRGRLIGHVVLRAATWRGEPALTIVDYLGAPGDLAALFAGSVGIARHHGAAALLCHTRNSHAYRPLRSSGFLRRKDRILFMTHTLEDDPDRDVIDDPANWFLTAADSDVDHP